MFIIISSDKWHYEKRCECEGGAPDPWPCSALCRSAQSSIVVVTVSYGTRMSAPSWGRLGTGGTAHAAAWREKRAPASGCHHLEAPAGNAGPRECQTPPKSGHLFPSGGERVIAEKTKGAHGHIPWKWRRGMDEGSVSPPTAFRRKAPLF